MIRVTTGWIKFTTHWENDIFGRKRSRNRRTTCYVFFADFNIGTKVHGKGKTFALTLFRKNKTEHGSRVPVRAKTYRGIKLTFSTRL
jgi:hypothetical protein